MLLNQLQFIDMLDKEYFLSDLVKILCVPKSWIMNLYTKRGDDRSVTLFRPYYRSRDPRIPHRFSDSDVRLLKEYFEAKKVFEEMREKLKRANRSE
jgi:hypothetical protein